jgi:hypothetical protein
MPFRQDSIQNAYNSALITGDYALGERYAACWLWLLMAEKDERAERHSKISPRTHIALSIENRRHAPSITPGMGAGGVGSVLAG